MYRSHHLDAHLLSCQNVDSRFAGTEEAITTLPYTVQQGNSLGDDGHGFYEPKPSAHGDREFGHIVTRMRKNRKVVVGHWQDEKAQNQIAAWMRVAAAWADAQDMLIIRFGDQMNNVAVTDGDKVSAEQVLGYHVDYYPINDVMILQCCQRRGREGTRSRILQSSTTTLPNWKTHGTEAYTKVWNSAKAEIAIRRVLKDTGAKGFTTNFNDLGDFDQIPDWPHSD